MPLYAGLPFEDIDLFLDVERGVVRSERIRDLVATRSLDKAVDRIHDYNREQWGKYVIAAFVCNPEELETLQDDTFSVSRPVEATLQAVLLR